MRKGGAAKKDLKTRLYSDEQLRHRSFHSMRQRFLLRAALFARLLQAASGLPCLPKGKLRWLQDQATAVAAARSGITHLIVELREVVGQWCRLDTSAFAPFLDLLRQLEPLAAESRVTDQEVVKVLALLGAWAANDALEPLPEAILLHGGHHLLAAERWVRGGRFKELLPTPALMDHVYGLTVGSLNGKRAAAAAQRHAIASVHAGARLTIVDGFVPKALASRLSDGFDRRYSPT